MVTRREVMTGGALGAVSGSMFASSANAAQPGLEGKQLEVLEDMEGHLESMTGSLHRAYETNGVGFGYIPKIREYFTNFFKTNFKFPDYMEIGLDVFYDLYDWHIKLNRQMEVSRVQENRVAIRFMFTLMVVRPDQDVRFIGLPYDR